MVERVGIGGRRGDAVDVVKVLVFQGEDVLWRNLSAKRGLRSGVMFAANQSSWRISFIVMRRGGSGWSMAATRWRVCDGRWEGRW